VSFHQIESLTFHYRNPAETPYASMTIDVSSADGAIETLGKSAIELQRCNDSPAPGSGTCGHQLSLVTVYFALCTRILPFKAKAPCAYSG
jgi:hypothetical protein